MKCTRTGRKGRRRGTGKISALHTNLLANSDFYTAAPVAEIGDGWHLRANLAAAHRHYQARDAYYMFSTSGDTLNVYNRQQLSWAPSTPYASMDNETL